MYTHEKRANSMKNKRKKKRGRLILYYTYIFDPH